ncbi:MAG: hypothetical protein ACRYG7_18190 [Janthinobacterium lividum]
MPKPRTPFPSLTPSHSITQRRYPEEWAWWAASDWQMVVTDTADGGVTLFSRHSKSTLWGAEATAAETATPELVRRFLAEALYLHLHPIKGERNYAETGAVCTEAKLAAFIRQQRRKASKFNP